MKKSEIPFMPDYFDQYINKVEDVSMIEALETSLDELENAPLEKWKVLGERIYAHGKWTIKDILQHCIDCERIFNYRCLLIARSDFEKTHSFDENAYVNVANANKRNVEDLLEEFIYLRKATIAMFKSFDNRMLLNSGISALGSEISVLAMAFIIVGHQKWHFQVAEEKYFPLLN